MLRLEATTRRDFHAAVSEAAEAVSAAGGWVTAHQFYSNTLAMIAFTIPAPALAGFAASLAAAHVALLATPETAGQTGDVPVQLTVTFIAAGPDVKREVPPFG